MKHREIIALLFVCLVILSFMCYQQAKTIDNMEKDISSLEYDVDTLEDKVKSLESEIDDMKLSIGILRDEMEDNLFYRQPPIKRR